MKKIIIDTEIYSNYFLFAAKCVETGKVIHLELHEDQPLDLAVLSNIMRKNTTISFNANNFDLPIIVAAMSGWNNAQIKKLCDSIIGSNRSAYRTYQDNNLPFPKWDHIDLIEVAPGMSSLKIYGGRLHSKKLQDLPIEPSALISPEQREELRKYCENDLQTTQELYQALIPQITLRESMTEQYGMDLRSKSDAQIAETVISSELQKITGKKPSRPTVADDAKFYYQDPEIVSFKSEQLNNILARVIKEPFKLGINGALVLPDWLKKEDIKIGGRKYQMGIGGLHSCEKSQYIPHKEGWFTCDFDVASYYPSIILQQKLAPKSMGKPFLKLYKSFVTERLEAKKSGNKVTADVLKIFLNGSFGKLGSKYSNLYAPELLLQTTITGQFCLLMLIEAMEENGIAVMSANTDGIVCHAPNEMMDVANEVCFDWMLETGYILEQTDYHSIAMLNVNNYAAVKTDGKIKGKGIFASTGLAKNPNCSIVQKAVAYCVSRNVPIEQTIMECNDITQFVTVRKVTGGARWGMEYTMVDDWVCMGDNLWYRRQWSAEGKDYYKSAIKSLKKPTPVKVFTKGAYLGKAVRFYYSSEVDKETCIHYAKNSNRVPMSGGARPLMDLPDIFPQDVDYQVYISMANELLKEVGYD